MTSLWGSALWVPHHLAAVVIGIMGFLISWDARSATETNRRILCALLAGLAYGNLVGTSLYVTVVIAAFLTLLTVITLFNREWKQFIAFAIAGSLAVVIRCSVSALACRDKAKAGRSCACPCAISGLWITSWHTTP